MYNNYTCDLFIKGKKNRLQWNRPKYSYLLLLDCSYLFWFSFLIKKKRHLKLKLLSVEHLKRKKLLYLFTYLFIHCVCRCERGECECVGSMWVYEEIIIVGGVGLVADKPQNIYGGEKTTCRNWFSPFTIWDLWSKLSPSGLGKQGSSPAKQSCWPWKHVLNTIFFYSAFYTCNFCLLKAKQERFKLCVLEYTLTVCNHYYSEYNASNCF